MATFFELASKHQNSSVVKIKDIIITKKKKKKSKIYLIYERISYFTLTSKITIAKGYLLVNHDLQTPLVMKPENEHESI